MHPCIAPLAWAVRHVMPLGPSVPLLAPQRYSCRKPWNSDLVSAFGSEFRDSLSKFLDTWVSQLVCQGAVRCVGGFLAFCRVPSGVALAPSVEVRNGSADFA